MGGFTDAILEDNGTTPFFIAGRISSALRGNIGGSTLELSGLEGVSDGTGEPTLALIGSPATAGTTRPQHYWQQFTAVTTDNTPDDITAGTDAPIAANSAVKLHWSVAAIRTGGTAGSPDDTASWDMTCTYKNLSGTATLVGACQKTSAKDNPSLDITPTVAGNLVQLMATGDTNNIYSWHVTWDTEFVN